MLRFLINGGIRFVCWRGLGKGKEKYHFMKKGFIKTGSRSETVLQYLFFIAVAFLFLQVGLV
jgi:hypothetical protein